MIYGRHRHACHNCSLHRISFGRHCCHPSVILVIIAISIVVVVAVGTAIVITAIVMLMLIRNVLDRQGVVHQYRHSLIPVVSVS